ncbi:MAG TPA: TRAFs-binding domain-containing protein [Thermoanaerobaculia bacterium]|nr:TRAFs-binding domain-containing protein [Thermoanaerobaculia bacterium]
MNRPLCFVLMPFGKKPDTTGTLIDFDAVYKQLIAPSIREAGLDPIRADEEIGSGIIHKPMFERLVLCEYAIADLTTVNANVFYELGIRHAARPWSTVLLFAAGGRLPFDVALLRAMPYKLTSKGTPADVKATGAELVKSLKAIRKAARDKPPIDSPLYDLLKDYPSPDVAHMKTDTFRSQALYSEEQKERLAEARKKGVDKLAALEKKFGDLANVEAGVVIDLLLSYRGAKAWERMIDLVEKMPGPLAEMTMVKEQYALALNRAKRDEEAERILTALIASRGPSSETYGILGRVYKDRWEEALQRGEAVLAKALLNKAIDAYRRGFEADWRDAYPGVNAVTLMELKEPPDPARLEILPVVSYAVERKIASGKPDYWDYATRLELAVLGNDEGRASEALGDALATIREPFEPETTARNLRLIREARERRGEAVSWVKEMEEALMKRAQPPAA